MKYVKTFENFNTTNENWLWGEGSVWSKMSNWFKSWKDRKLAEGAELFNKWSKENPEKVEEIKSKVKPEFDKLSDEEKEELKNKLEQFKGETPPADVIAAAEEVVQVQEKLKSSKFGSKVYESYSLILEEAELSLARKILYYLALGVHYIGIISAIIGGLLFLVQTGAFVAGIGALSFVSGPLLVGLIFGGVAVMLLGGITQYHADPSAPGNEPAPRSRTGWESSGGPIM
jgi:hypothetical protein